jgi:dipicolinate synthase subunit A
MPLNWKDQTIAIVGGDRREREIARLAGATGADVRAYGFPWPEKGIKDVTLATDATAALKGANFALFPIPGMSAEGALFAPSAAAPITPDRAMLAGMRAPAHIILGWANEALKEHCRALSITLHEYEWDVDLMLLRGPAIVEGMLRAIIENTEITIHKSRVCVVGQGTIGFLVARWMVALGAYTHVAARNAVQRAAAYAAGAEAHTLDEIVELAPRLDTIISTVPAQIVGRSVLRRLPEHALLVDLAAPPGGIDRDVAKELGLKFIWARGMGSRAPVTVGASQWSGIKKRIEAICGGKQ